MLHLRNIPGERQVILPLIVNFQLHRRSQCGTAPRKLAIRPNGALAVAISPEWDILRYTEGECKIATLPFSDLWRLEY